MASRAVLNTMPDGKEYTFKELSEMYGIPVTILHSRYYRGDRGEYLVRKQLSKSATSRKNSMRSCWRWMSVKETSD